MTTCPGTHCRRCGHKLSAPASVKRGYSLRCWRLERAEAKERDDAIERAIAGYSDRQKADAKTLIKAGKLKPAARKGLYRITSRDGKRTYSATAAYCPCRSFGPCYHRAACLIAERWYFGMRAPQCVWCVNSEGPVRHPSLWDAGDLFSDAGREVWLSYQEVA